MVSSLLAVLWVLNSVPRLEAQTGMTDTTGVRVARLQVAADGEELQVAPKIGEQQVALLQINGEDKKPEDRPRVKAGDRVTILSATGSLLVFFIIQQKTSRPQSQTVQVKDGKQALNVPGNYSATNVADLEARTSSGSVLQPLAKTDSDAAFSGALNPEDVRKGTNLQAVDKNTGEVKGQADCRFVAVTGAWTKPALSKPGVLVDLYVGIEGNPDSKVLVSVPLPSGLVFADGTTNKSYVRRVKDLNRPLDKVKSTEPVLLGQRRTYAIPISTRLIEETDGIGRVGEWADGIVTSPRPTLDGYVPDARRMADLKATIDGQLADTTFDRTSGAFSVRPKSDLQAGNHTVQINGRRNDLWIPLTIGTLAMISTTQDGGCRCTVQITNVRAKYIRVTAGKPRVLDELEVTYAHAGECHCDPGILIHVYWFDPATGTNKDEVAYAPKANPDRRGGFIDPQEGGATSGLFPEGLIGVYAKCHNCGATSAIWGDHPMWTPPAHRFGELAQQVWHCGSTTCPGHSSPGHRCEKGVWKCGAPNCPGHSSPDHRCKNSIPRDELYPEAVDMKDIDSWEELRDVVKREPNENARKQLLDETLKALKKRREVAKDKKTQDWLDEKIKITERAIEAWRDGKF